MKSSTRNMLKKLGVGLLAVGLIGGTVALGNKAYQSAKATDKSFSPKLEVGGLVTETGEYENDLTTLYTKEAFKAQGLKVKLDIDAQVTYQVFFYDDADVFVSATEKASKSGAVVLPEGATSARLEVMPVVDPGEVQPELSKFDAFKVSRDIEIVVDKKQPKPAAKVAA